VFILKVVKVLCFDTLLQVLILKVDRGGRRNRREERTKATAKDNAPFEALGKETQRALSLRREGWESVIPIGKTCTGTPHPGIWEKRLQAVENKGRESEKGSKEAAGD
jgi:hypothetical protein